MNMMKSIGFNVLILLIMLIPIAFCSYFRLGGEYSPDYPQPWSEAKNVYEFTVKDLDGRDVSLNKYKGFLLMITNIATHSSFSTLNFNKLKNLQDKYYSKGLRILGFPTPQFLFEEPYDNPSIREYVVKRHLNFDVFGNCIVNGKYAEPLWKYLQNFIPGVFQNCIKWNFTKFIIDKNGIPVERLTVMDSDEIVESKILKYLKE